MTDHLRECIFCGDKPLTKEHLFADWMKSYIDRALIHHNIETALDFPDHQDSSIKQRSGDPHSRRIKCVCKPCNSGWMSQLQEKTKPIFIPMLQGGETNLHRRAQRQIATWVVMTVMAGEFIDLDHVTISVEERRQFRLDRSVQAHWKIWIGAHRRRKEARWIHKAMSFTEKEVEAIYSQTPDRANSQATTILLGKHLIIHVMSSPIKPRLIRTWQFPQHFAPFMLQIWPIRNASVSWPPERAMTDKGILTVSGDLYGRSLHVVRNRR